MILKEAEFVVSLAGINHVHAFLHMCAGHTLNKKLTYTSRLMFEHPPIWFGKSVL